MSTLETLPARFGREKTRYGTHLKLLWLGLLVLCIVASFGILVFVRERSERARLAARMTKLGAEGTPIDDASLEALYHAQTSTTIRAQWRKVFQLVRTESESTASGDDQALMQRLAELRKEIASAVSNDRPCRFIEDFEAIYTLLPYLGELRSTTKLLASHAQAAINCGEIDTALQDCELMLGCADAISADPFLISGMVSNALQSNALDVHRTCLENILLSEPQLSAFLQTCRKRGVIGDRWKLSISGERASLLALLTDNVHEESLATHDPYFHWLGVRGKAANNIADLFDKLEAVPTDDLQTIHHELAMIQADWNQSVNGSILAKVNNRLSAEIITDDYERFSNSFIHLVIKYRMTSIAVGLRLYQKKFGEFPQSLEELQRVGIAPGELRTFSNSSFSYVRNRSHVRFFDEDESWHPPANINSPKGDEAWVWTLDTEPTQ